MSAARRRERDDLLRVVARGEESPAAWDRVVAALGESPAATGGLWSDIARFHLAPLLYFSLHRSGRLAELDAEPREWLRDRFGRNGLRVAALRKVALDLAGALGAAGIPVVFLKGLAAARWYPRPALRCMADGDLLVPRDRFAAAREVLRHAGFAPHPYVAVGGEDPHAVRLLRPDPLPGSDEPLEIDLHHDVFPPGGFPGWTEQVWASAVPLPGSSDQSGSVRSSAVHRAWSGCRSGDTNARLPAPEVELCLTALHLFKHCLDPGHRYRAIADTAALLRARGDQLDWDQLAGTTDNPPLAAALLMLLRLAEPEHPGAAALADRCSAHLRERGMTRRIERLLAAAARVPPVREHDLYLGAAGRHGNPLAAAPALLARVLSRGGFRKYAALRGAGAPPDGSALALLRALPENNWRYTLLTYGFGRLHRDLHRGDQRARSRHNAPGG